MSGLLTAAQVGEILGGATADQVMEWRRVYGWPHVRIGRRFMWTPEQVEQITRAHVVKAGKVDQSGRTQRSARRSA